jgi:ureidoglycolate lyase
MTEPVLTTRIAAAPLNGKAFAPFGDVIAHEGDAARRYLAAPFEHDSAAIEPRFWVTRVTEGAHLPLRIEQLERHPYSAQSFIPLLATRYLVVVARGDSRGVPNLDSVQAFIAASHQGVCYRPGIWHHRLTALDAPAEFAIFMAMTRRNDDEFHDLSSTLEIVDSGGLAGERHGRE